MDGPATGRGLEALVREHAALRRVATLVARETATAVVFAAVTRETGELLGARRTTLFACRKHGVGARRGGLVRR